MSEGVCMFFPFKISLLQKCSISSLSRLAAKMNALQTKTLLLLTYVYKIQIFVCFLLFYLHISVIFSIFVADFVFLCEEIPNRVLYNIIIN